MSNKKPTWRGNSTVNKSSNVAKPVEPKTVRIGFSIRENKITWFLGTVVAIVLLAAIQFATPYLDSQIITGAMIDAVLILTVMTIGLPSGCIVALVSPIFAKLLGAIVFWQIVPFVMIANVIFVAIWFFEGNFMKAKMMTRFIVAAVVAAIVKFIILHLSIGKYAVPTLLKLSKTQSEAITNTFSLPQLLMALVGGVIACILIPILRDAMRNLNR
ncbi:MAG: hypothetical protein LBM02_08500 [Lachnospiraceae bacterium]|jgi:uncharacterized protein YacL|nr:hypothetical protein [Lachnospiraceae bacterium]